MKTINRTAAAAELLLIFPAVLFMTSLFAREIQPMQFEPAHTAKRIVDWYAAQPHIGLWLLLIAMPLTALITGCALLPRAWQSNPELRQAARQAFAMVQAHIATLLVATATVTAFGILAIVALHMITGLKICDTMFACGFPLRAGSLNGRNCTNSAVASRPSKEAAQCFRSQSN